MSLHWDGQGGLLVTDTPTEPEDDSAWTKLRRRKVVQWGLAYVAGAWAVLQSVGFVADAFHWPDATKQVTTLALLVGLPVVLVLAWYHGDRGEQRVGGTERAILTLLLLLGGGVFWYYQRTTDMAAVAEPTSPEAASIAAADRSIAVLPFVNMSPDQDQGYFADGISEELLNLLAQVPELRVIARTSSFSFKGKDVDVAGIAQKLNVAHVLQGSVRKSGDTMRITAQLVRASDSSQLWSQTYDRQLTDVFKVQDEIAAAVVEQLRIKLLDGAPTLRATDPRAYALYLQARDITRQYNPAAFERSIAVYRQALAIDPNFAPAWVGLAGCYYDLIDLGFDTRENGVPRTREAIGQALASDPSYAPAYAKAALVEGTIDRDLAAAARRIEDGLELDPANVEVIEVAALIARRLGRLDQAIALGEYLVARDPVNVLGHDRLAFAYRHAGRLDDALAQYRKVLQLSPHFGSERAFIGEVLLQQGQAAAALTQIEQEPLENYRLIGLAQVYHALGRDADADAALNALIAKHSRSMSYNIALVLGYRGETDRAFEWLEKAIEFQDLGIGSIIVNPSLEGLRSDPRWLPLLRRLGVAPEQLAAIKFDVTVPK
jgi:TolB-like protein/tetratricopeptide (TPR) repeat protein